MNAKKNPTSLAEVYKQAQEDGLSPYDTDKAIEKFLSDKARENFVPLHGQFELTPVCNLDCKMCYVHLTPEQMGNRKPLPPEFFEKVFSDAAERGMSYASLSGGECLTYPDFDRLYLYLNGLGIKTSILTNGLLLGKERIEFFKEYRPRKIQLTVYGNNDDAYERVTGRRCFETVFSNIKAAKEAGLNLFITVTPNGYLGDDAKELIKLVHSLGIRYEINSSLFTPRDSTGRNKDSVTADKYIELYKLRAELNGEKLVKKDISLLPQPNTEGKEVFGLRCGAGRNGFTVDWEGNMHPCNRLYGISASIEKLGFDGAWKHLNEEVSAFPIPKECAGCAYKRACSLCAANHKDNGGEKGCASPLICEFGKLMVAEGLAELI